ncbi:MAG TPA: GNAT family N-acetyltransferase, partial [Phycisphaerae bacterium]|nr:GNAT family N-acetyltransferase [Phycisphaerae bacterium]
RGAEVAFTVQDEWQHKGLGTYLFQRLVQIARGNGIERFTAEVLAENAPMLAVFHRSNLKVTTADEGGVVHVTMTVPPEWQPRLTCERPPPSAPEGAG